MQCSDVDGARGDVIDGGKHEHAVGEGGDLLEGLGFGCTSACGSVRE